VWVETERALGEDTPAVYVEVLRACGALAEVFPEIDALFGVPQPPKWHPEIDTGIHTLQVLEVAASLSQDTTVRFAALLHDVGKALTPRDQWPSHIGHEAAGAKLIEKLCERLRVPTEHRDLAVLVARHHARVHRVGEQRPGTILELLEMTDAFRRGERFERFLLACEADSRGRGPDLRKAPYPQAAQLRSALTAAAAVKLPPEVLANEKGPIIAERLRAARITAIRSLNAA
jgi:tRNA nucleotidyltransferase (CCA-adding enzyme)